ncbi:Beta-L-arabinofuranosidase [Teratosphaeria destructans]|uniref:Beta-L-arabinofuranosidase n=1 Tax=Teratosphaeria destructans TaxID=418781 RepID=A0A9W7SQ61_9PEZI|nr:Beta-L-arabinofuranosidase [Teratosphaeria destructans]
MAPGGSGAKGGGGGGGGGATKASGKTKREAKSKGVDKKTAKQEDKPPRAKVLEQIKKKVAKKDREAERKAKKAEEGQGAKAVSVKVRARERRGEFSDKGKFLTGGADRRVHVANMKIRLTSKGIILAVSANAIGAKAQVNTPLVPFTFEPLPLGTIKPTGWLRDQLQLMADGLAGHEYDFYKYVANSSWLGGDQEYSNLNEGFPYWFNGLVPLAYGLDDARLKEQVHSSAQTVLRLQQRDGWLGPETGVDRNFWARYPLCLGLIQLAEANRTWTGPIVSALHNFTQLMHNMLADNYTGYIAHPGDELDSDGTAWGQVRSQDMIITLQWLYEHHPGNHSQILLNNMQYLHKEGLNWEDWYNEAAYFGQDIEKDLNTVDSTVTSENYPFEHGVNVGQGLKAPAVVRRFTHNESLVQTAYDGVNWTMTYHGGSHGSVIADERLVGLAPYSGAELCTSVESMYSLAYLYQALGTNYYADRAERIAFNGLPVMLTPDWWARQYMAQQNMPYAEALTETPFYNTNAWGQTYGLEPNFPCCTVNHPQGYPKFLSNSFVKVGTNGLAHALLSPASVKVALSSSNVFITCTTAYPFLDTLGYTISADAPFSFYVRVPAWAGSGSTVAINAERSTALSPDAESDLQLLNISKGVTAITYTLESSVRTEARENDTIAVYRGAILYTLEVAHTNTSTLPKPYNSPTTYFPSDYAPAQSKDWQYQNTSAWNYAIDPSTLVYVGPNSTLADYGLDTPIWSPGAPPGYITAQGCLIDWPMAFDGSVPGYPPTGDARKCLGVGDVALLKLVPYASAKTGMAELPVISLNGSSPM